jgi:methanogenic corrinoid protein MtbC1
MPDEPKLATRVATAGNGDKGKGVRRVMISQKERMLMAARGEMPDRIPFAPRLDMWYNANRLAGTLPARYRDADKHDIARSEGWALYAIEPEEFDRSRDAAHCLHRAIGLYPIKEAPYRVRFAPSVTVTHRIAGGEIAVAYSTPVGTVTTATEFTAEMVASGATQSWVKEHPVKSPEDYRVLAYLFESLELEPAYEEFRRWRQGIGNGGLAAAYASAACSPMHHIQKDFLDPTAFYYHYHDHYRQLRALADSVGNFYRQLLSVCTEAPAEAVVWGENLDGTLTPPPYVASEILPWLQKASAALQAAGKLVVCHTDGDYNRLMDLIGASGIDMAESICPLPLTKVPMDRFYHQWGDRITLMGGIPSDMLIPETTSEADFEAYLNYLFKAVVPGRRVIFGVTDNVPITAAFQRLVRIGERVAAECRLPLEGEPYRPQERESEEAAPMTIEDKTPDNGHLRAIQADIYAGDERRIEARIEAALAEALTAERILQEAMIPAMEVIGVRFGDEELFMPEVLRSARAMSTGLAMLEPYLAADRPRSRGRVLLGTVCGDMHDIGKNLVAVMLRGVGFEVRDLGINVGCDRFVEETAAYRPDVLGLSALLTTTMPEMGKVIAALRAAEPKAGLRVIVGGAPVTDGFARKIGADGYADSAGEAVELVKRLLSAGAGAGR